RQRGNAAVDDDLEPGVRGLEAPHTGVIERGQLAVLLGREALEPGLARVHDEARAAGVGDDINKAIKVAFAVLVVDTDPALDGDRHAQPALHRRYAARNQLGLGHQTGAEPALLYPVRRTADIEVDFIVTKRLPQLRGIRERPRLAPGQLQGHGMFGRR